MILYEQVTGEGLLVVLGVPHHPRQCLSYNLITLNMSTDTGELRPRDPPPRYSLQAARADASKQSHPRQQLINTDLQGEEVRVLLLLRHNINQLHQL